MPLLMFRFFLFEKVDTILLNNSDMKRRNSEESPLNLHGCQRVVLFDGLCVLCNGCMDFLLKHDIEKRLTFGQMQSPQGQKLLQELGITMDVCSPLLPPFPQRQLL